MEATDVSVTGAMMTGGHEQVVFVADASLGLRAVIAVHSTALGPSLGGIRFWHYPSEQEALADALRLSEAMSLKAAIAGLHQGGGKAVVLWEDPHQPRTRDFLRALGQAIDELGGRYIAAEDVGATPADMDGIALETPWVTGVDTRGGSGDPSPVTAVGVMAAMRAAARELDGDPSLSGRRVVVQGAGHVGSHLVELLVGCGASVAVADIDGALVDRLVRAHGVDALPPERVLTEPCDILAPCALGGVLNADTVPALECRAVVGAANNQLAEPSDDDALAGRGIVYVPDFVANAGGIINIAEEFVGYDPGRARALAAGIEHTTTRVLALARELGIAPGRAAETMARRRIAEEGAGRRWRPGDPAAWTQGEPLRTLRPGVTSAKAG
ncbi:MAG TPA: Glu/Leu/Phe/Val dehydrogenase dimerization domain-containing protein [Acidimicrobiia bacterium]